MSDRQWTCHNCYWDPRTEDDMRRLQGIGGLPPPPGGLDGLWLGRPECWSLDVVSVGWSALFDRCVCVCVKDPIKDVLQLSPPVFFAAAFAAKVWVTLDEDGKLCCFDVCFAKAHLVS